MDTSGNEFEFSYRSDRTMPEGPDPVRSATKDGPVGQDDYAAIVAASTALPRRVTDVEVAHALSPLLLEEVECNFLVKGNGSRVARELAQWVHRLRGTADAYRARK